MFVCIYGVLHYLSSIAILTTTRDQIHAPCASLKTPTPFKDPSHTTLQTTNLSWHELCLEFLAVHGNKLRLFEVKTFPLFVQLI